MTNSPQEIPPYVLSTFEPLHELPGKFEELYMPKNAAASFSQQHLGTYQVGIRAFDAAVTGQLVRGALDTYKSLQDTTANLYQTASPAPANAKDMLASEQPKPGNNPQRGPLDQNGTPFTIIADHMAAHSAKGIEDSTMQPLLHGAEWVTYYGQNPTAAHKAALHLYDEHNAELGLPPNGSENGGVEALYAYLQERGVLDLSRQTLNRRFETFEKTMQVSILELMGATLNIVSQVDTMRRNQAAYGFLGLLNRGKANDLNSRLEMLKRIAGDWQENVNREEDPALKEIVGRVAVRAIFIEHSVQKRIAYFTKIYDELGFKYPMAGMGVQRVKARESQKIADQAEQQKQAAEQAAARTRLLSELETITPQTVRQVEQLNKHWSLPSKTFKIGGFNDARYALIGESQNHQLPGEATFTKDEARHVIDILATLQKHFATQKAPEIKDTITTSCIAEQSLAGAVHYINKTLQLLKTGAAKIEEPRQLTAYFDKLQENWAKYRPIIEQTWPQNGAHFAEQLNQLFAPALEVADSMDMGMVEVATAAQEQGFAGNLPQSQSTEAAELAAAQAKIETLPVLDVVVLPPKPQEHIIRTELQRLGVKPRDLTPEKIERFNELLEFAGLFDNYELAVTKLGPKSPKRYYVLSFKHESKKYTVAESVSLERATYIIAEHLTAGTGLELLDLYKNEARELGAQHIDHTNNGKPHHEKIFDKLVEMHEKELL